MSHIHIISYLVWFPQNLPRISTVPHDIYRVRRICEEYVYKKRTHTYDWRFTIPMKYLFRFIFAWTLQNLRYEGFWKDGKQHGHGHYTTTVRAFPFCEFCGKSHKVAEVLYPATILTYRDKVVTHLITIFYPTHVCIYIFIHRRNVSSFDGAVWFLETAIGLVDFMGIFHGIRATSNYSNYWNIGY